MREIIETVDGCVARATEYIGTHNVSADDVPALAQDKPVVGEFVPADLPHDVKSVCILSPRRIDGDDVEGVGELELRGVGQMNAVFFNGCGTVFNHVFRVLRLLHRGDELP